MKINNKKSQHGHRFHLITVKNTKSDNQKNRKIKSSIHMKRHRLKIIIFN